jgi:hypothetical protein
LPPSSTPSMSPPLSPSSSSTASSSQGVSPRLRRIPGCTALVHLGVELTPFSEDDSLVCSLCWAQGFQKNQRAKRCFVVLKFS